MGTQVPQPQPGDRWGGFEWDGAAWVPWSDGSGNTYQQGSWQRPGMTSAPPPPMPAPAFADPHYAFGLTRRTSDDLQFIARWIKVTLILSLVTAILALVPLLVLLGQLLALLGQLGVLGR